MVSTDTSKDSAQIHPQLIQAEEGGTKEEEEAEEDVEAEEMAEVEDRGTEHLEPWRKGRLQEHQARRRPGQLTRQKKKGIQLTRIFRDLHSQSYEGWSCRPK